MELVLLHREGCSLAPSPPREYNTWAEELTRLDFNGFSSPLELEMPENLFQFSVAPRPLAADTIH